MTRRGILAVVAALAIWATGMYPPWRESYVVRSENGDSGIAVTTVATAIGNDWLINQKSFPELALRRGDSLPMLRAGIGYSVDFGRLAVEWAIIAALYGALVVVLRVPPVSAPAAKP